MKKQVILQLMCPKMSEKKDKKIKNLHIRIEDLERLLRKSRKSERFWRKKCDLLGQETIDLSLALRFAANDKIQQISQMSKSQKGAWELKDEKS